MRKNLHKLTLLSSQFSPKIRICFRCNKKHSEECLITYPNTSKCVKKTRLRLVFSTHFSVFGYVMKHSSECFIYYIFYTTSFTTHQLLLPRPGSYLFTSVCVSVRFSYKGWSWIEEQRIKVWLNLVEMFIKICLYA